MGSGDGSFYRLINEDLRSSDRTLAKPWIPYLKLLDSALNKLSTVQKPIWRGLRGDFSNQYKKDEILTWWSITSCSLSLHSATRFLKSNKHRTLLMIEGKNARDIHGYTCFQNESEYILKPGTYLRVEDVDLPIIHLIELSDEEIVQERAKQQKKSQHHHHGNIAGKFDILFLSYRNFRSRRKRSASKCIH